MDPRLDSVSGDVFSTSFDLSGCGGFRLGVSTRADLSDGLPGVTDLRGDSDLLLLGDLAFRISSKNKSKLQHTMGLFCNLFTD